MSEVSIFRENERLQAENKALREALESFARIKPYKNPAIIGYVALGIIASDVIASDGKPDFTNEDLARARSALHKDGVE